MEVADTAIIGLPNYDMFVESAFSAMTFRGKTLEDWSEEIEFMDLHEGMPHQELKNYNFDFSNKSRIIMNNLAYARSSLKACEMHYDAQVSQKKEAISRDFEISHPGARKPSIDAIKTMAENQCMESLVAKNIAEMFLMFWQAQYEKVKIIDSRLQGIGYLYGLEMRNTHV